MKKNDFIIILGLFILGFSIYVISYNVYNVSWYIMEGYAISWNNADTLNLVWWILAPIIVLVIGAFMRSHEQRQRNVPDQIAHQVSEVIESIKFCTSCGNQNPKEAMFCIQCGQKFAI